VRDGLFRSGEFRARVGQLLRITFLKDFGLETETVALRLKCRDVGAHLGELALELGDLRVAFRNGGLTVWLASRRALVGVAGSVLAGLRREHAAQASRAQAARRGTDHRSGVPLEPATRFVRRVLTLTRQRFY